MESLEELSLESKQIEKTVKTNLLDDVSESVPTLD
jgi:hypothetical protein